MGEVDWNLLRDSVARDFTSGEPSITSLRFHSFIGTNRLLKEDHLPESSSTPLRLIVWAERTLAESKMIGLRSPRLDTHMMRGLAQPKWPRVARLEREWRGV